MDCSIIIAQTPRRSKSSPTPACTSCFGEDSPCWCSHGDGCCSLHYVLNIAIWNGRSACSWKSNATKIILPNRVATLLWNCVNESDRPQLSEAFTIPMTLQNSLVRLSPTLQCKRVFVFVLLHPRCLESRAPSLLFFVGRRPEPLYKSLGPRASCLISLFGGAAATTASIQLELGCLWQKASQQDTHKSRDGLPVWHSRARRHVQAKANTMCLAHTTVATVLLQ